MKIVTSNWSCRIGEIDLIAIDGPELVFVEVKTRVRETVRPELQVGPAKQAKLICLAKLYLQQHPWPGPSRFDVVAVVKGAEGETVRHHRRAFTA